MRIAILGSRGIPARWGGAEVVSEELATRLAAKGHQVTVYCRARYSDPSRPREYRSVKLVYTPHLPGKYLESPSHEMVSAVHSLLQPFDVYYVLCCRASWCYALHRLLGKRVVFNTNGLDWLRRKWGAAVRAYLRFSFWAALRLATRVTSDSRAICEYIQREFAVEAEYLSWGAYVLPSVDASVLENYGLTPGGYFLVVCRIEPENNVDLIVRAFEGVETDKRLVVVGGVNYRSGYVRRLRRTRDPRVVFTGPVYRPGHVDALLRHALAYIDGHEVGGTSPGLLRAMGCGACVLVFDRPFNAEVVGDAGLLWRKSEADLREKMRRVLADPDLAARCGALAVERVRRRYTWEASADAHERFFLDLVRGEAPSPAWRQRGGIRDRAVDAARDGRSGSSEP
jgi:glycosyltransferase involved in cell wall biosynthesis